MGSKKAISVAVALLSLFALCPALFAQVAGDGATGIDIQFQTSATGFGVYWSGFATAADHMAITVYTNPANIAGSALFSTNDITAAAGGIPYAASGTYSNSAAFVAQANGAIFYVIVYSHNATHTVQQQAPTNGVTIDTDPPVAGAATINGGNSYQSSTTTISTGWSGFSDPESGISGYAVGVGTGKGIANIVPLTAYPNTATSATFSGLSLTNGTTYYTTVQAINGVGGIIAIAGGGNHTVALKNDGTVWTWGYNQYGQLGDTTTINRSTPVEVATGANTYLSGIIAIAGGYYNTVALKNDGTVWTWGYNPYGQLGNNSTTDSHTPVQVKGVGGSGFLTGIIAIAGGQYHTVALKNDGTVWTWGDNTYDELGDTTTIQRTTPVEVSTGAGVYLSGIITIASGGTHTVVIKNDGTVWTWGYNVSGQLGDTTTINRSTPVEVATGAGAYLSGIIAIAGGYKYTIAIKNDGTVWDWGDNGNGQLGDTTTIQRTTPVEVATGAGVYLLGITAIAGGQYHTVALKNDGTVWTWGANGNGQLGDTTTIQRNTPVEVATAANTYLSGIVSIASQNIANHTIALKNDGTVWDWGDNANGQLGNNSTTDSDVPVNVAGFSGATASSASSSSLTIDTTSPVAGTATINGGAAFQSSTTTISAGWSGFSDPISGISAYRVGVGTYQGATDVVPFAIYSNTATTATFSGLTLTNGTKYYATVQAINGVGGVIAIASGGYNNIALDSNGTALAWGNNIYGQLGDGTTTQRNTPVQVSGLTSITAIACGTYHTIALKSDGTVWTWGYNGNGQLGNNSTTDSHTPVQVSGLTGITAVAGGGYHTIALKGDGTVWTWGNNTYGQLGNGTTTQENTPVQVSGLTGITAIAGGAYHTIALKSDGTVWACGQNVDGQLGDGTTVSRSVPVQVSGLTGITAIAGGAYHTIAIKNDQTVWSWGFNSSGQLGNGTTTQENSPVQVGGLTNMTAIAGGGYHTIAIKNDQTVWSWGLNSSGQLGNGTTTQENSPVQVSGLINITAIAGGIANTVALYNNGTVWDWGYNAYGQLGNGTTTYSNTPVQVLLISATISYATSSGVMIDTVGPTVGSINPTNGSGATISYQQSTSMIYASWSGFNDTIDGVNIYQVGIGTSPGATNVLALTNYANTASSATFSGLFLTSGTPYYITIKASDVAGNATIVNSSSITPDTTGPVAGTLYFANNVGTTTAQASTTTLYVYWANWSDAISGMATGAATYRIGVGSTPGATDVVALTNYANSALSAEFTGLALITGAKYYATIVASDVAGNTTTLNSIGVTIAPPQVNDGLGPGDIDFQSSATTLSGNWLNFSNALSGITTYQVGIVTAPFTGSYVVPLTSFASAASNATFTGLAIGGGMKYYVQVTAVAPSGSVTVYSNGVTVNIQLANTTITTSAGTLGNITNQSASSLTGVPPPGVAGFPDGLYGFNISGLLLYASVNVTITLPSALTPGSYQWYWYNATTNIYTAVPVGNISTPDNKTFIIVLQDGGFGDADGAANGIIVDPVGPANISSVGASSAFDIASANSSSSGASCGTIGLDAIAILIVAYWLRRKKASAKSS